MNRRQILAASAGAAVMGAANAAGAADKPAAQQKSLEYYELRKYHTRMGPQSTLAKNYFKDALVPALSRLGIGPVGVFATLIGDPAYYVLIPAKKAETLLTLEARLEQDAEYNKAGEPFLTAPAVQPAYERFENSLMVAFDGWPQLQVTPATAERKKRCFELRTYECSSDRDYRRKIEMFNSGEFPAFQSAGFWQIFYGDVLVGTRRPCLTYMLGFGDLAERSAMWTAFVRTPEWKRLTSDQRYIFEEIMSKVDNSILMPLESSQI